MVFLDPPLLYDFELIFVFSSTLFGLFAFFDAIS